MTPEAHQTLDRPPGKVRSYARSAFLPRRGFSPGRPVPPLRLTREALRFDAEHVARHRAFCGGGACGQMPFLYPLSLLFHYHLGIFAHRHFPSSLTRVLGLRNHVVQRRPIALHERLDLEIRTAGQRVVPKGLEFDLRSVLSHGGEPAWESVHVYYLRGDFGGNDTPARLENLQPLRTRQFETSWEAPSGGGWQFARLSGDFNPAHFFAPWARLRGFERDFCHTQRVIADCLRRLPDAGALHAASPLRLDVAFKGPVYYGSKLVMAGVTEGDRCRFDLYCGRRDKPALAGCLQRVTAGQSL
jgi:hypothetical protein